MLKTGMEKGRLSQLFQADYPFGELAGRRLAERLGLPASYFDLMPVELSEEARRLALTFDRIPSCPEKARMFDVVVTAFESMSRSKD